MTETETRIGNVSFTHTFARSFSVTLFSRMLVRASEIPLPVGGGVKHSHQWLEASATRASGIPQ